jgi:type IV pilus modification protein PilV
MRPQRLVHDQRGFTLIEVLIATALLSFGLLSVASMQVVAVRVNTSSQRLALATTLVQDKVEELMALPFTHASLADTTPVGSFQSYTATNPSPPPGYTLTWQVDVNAAGDSRTVIVTAQWMKYGQPRDFSLSFTRTVFQ